MALQATIFHVVRDCPHHQLIEAHREPHLAQHAQQVGRGGGLVGGEIADLPVDPVRVTVAAAEIGAAGGDLKLLVIFVKVKNGDLSNFARRMYVSKWEFRAVNPLKKV